VFGFTYSCFIAENCKGYAALTPRSHVQSPTCSQFLLKKSLEGCLSLQTSFFLIAENFNICLHVELQFCFSDEDDDDDDDTEALMAELERIKKERAEENLRKVCCFILSTSVKAIYFFRFYSFVW
jgi:hypothetical protein